MKTYAIFMFKTFSFVPQKIEKILDYREVPEISEI